MGWANCGKDDLGRPIGYAHEGTCDEEGCENEIERSLDYACGGMHGAQDADEKPCCARYFCSDHLFFAFDWRSRRRTYCSKCCEQIDKE